MRSTKNLKNKQKRHSRKLNIYDILPLEKVKLILIKIIGIKTYNSNKFILYSTGWRFVFGVFVIVYFLTGLSPLDILKKSIKAINGNTETINLYASNCNSDSGWMNNEKVNGAPNISPEGDITLFSSLNAAVYSGNNSSIVCGNFSILKEPLSKTSADKQEDIDDEVDLTEIEESIIDNDFYIDKDDALNFINDNEEASTTNIINELDLNIASSSEVMASNTNNIEQDFEETQNEDKEIEILNIPDINEEEIIKTEIIEISEEEEIEIIENEEQDSEVEIQLDPNEEELLEALDYYEEFIVVEEEPGVIEDNNEDSEEELIETDNKEDDIEEISLFNKVKNLFSGLIVNAQEFITGDIKALKDLGEFKSAKIKFSFAIGEHETRNMRHETENTEHETIKIINKDVVSTSSEEIIIDELDIDNQYSSTSIEEIIEEIILSSTTTDEKINYEIKEDDSKHEEEAEVVEIVEPVEDNAIVEVEEIDSEEEEHQEEVIEEISEEVVDNSEEEIIENSEEKPAEDIISEDEVSFLNIWNLLLGVSLAQAQLNKFLGEPKIIIWYSIKDENSSSTDLLLWQKLDTITADNASNALNGDYFSYDAPFLENWSDVENFKIKFEGVLGDESLFTSYLDSVWVEAEYDSETELEKLEKRKRWEEALDLLSEQLVFKMGQDGELRFRYNKNENRIWDTLSEIIGFGSFWKDVNISARIVDSTGQELDIPLTMIFEEDGEFAIKLPEDIRGLKPGKYTIRFHIEDTSGEEIEVFDLKQDFNWGVLAFNTNKSIYLPNEKAYMQMAVLDSNGHTICDADLTIRITAPDGSIRELKSNTPEVDFTIYNNPQCGPKNVISEPDYYAYYNLRDAGIYKIKLKAKTKAGINEIIEEIEVRDDLPFDIERTSATRIYPKANYEMKIILKANEDYKGDLVEYVPSIFKITNLKVRIINSSERDPFGSNYHFSEEIYGEEKILHWQDIELLSGDILEIKYVYDAPDRSPELYLLGPLQLEKNNILFQESRQWQIAADALVKRARTVMFFAGAHNEEVGAYNDSDYNQELSQFNFRLAETGVDIKSAFVMLEAQFEAYADNASNYTYSMAFDACAESCTADAYTGTNVIIKDDGQTVAYDENYSDQVRLVLDVTDETQLAAYTGGGAEFEGQVGYNFKRGVQSDSIGSAKAVLILTYTYDEDTENYTNTVVYPLESTNTTPDPDDSGTRQSTIGTDCTYGTDCPTFDYNMEIPDFPGVATTTNRLSYWYKMHELIDNTGGTDVNTDISLDAGVNTSDAFHHESARGGTQSAQAAMYFSPLVGYEENSAQTIEYRSLTGAADNHYMIGGEVFETYMASSSAATKTRTVSFTIGAIDNGETDVININKTSVYFPENGSGTGVVTIKKAWLRIKTSNAVSAGRTFQVSTKVDTNATSSVYTYNYNPGGTVPKPAYDIFHIIPSSDYSDLETANASNGVEVALGTLHSSTLSGVTSAELMITYTYTSEAEGYLTSLQLYGGQMSGVSTTGATSTLANSVAPETGNKTMRSGGILAHYLISESDGTVGAGSTFDLDTNISTTTPACVRSRVGVNDSNNNGNIFFDYYEDVTSGLTTEDDQSYEVCYKSDETLSPNDGAHMGGVLTYTYQWENTAPTSTFESILQKGDGLGTVDITIEVFDADGHDSRAKIEYATGTTCVFSGSNEDPVLDETDGNITADFDDPNIENDNTYQIGTVDAYITTASGSNSVFFDWQSRNDIPNVEGDYCLRLTANDGNLDQATLATTTVYVDNIIPTAPGALSLSARTGATTTLLFGATSTETNFKEYKIFYKEYDGTDPDEGDSLHSSSTDINLGDKFFNDQATTSIGGLTPKTTYSYAIWAYDDYGNRSSSSRVDIITNDAPDGSFASVAQKSDGLGTVDITIDITDANNDEEIRAKIEYILGETCESGGMSDPTLDENTDNISSSFGNVHIDNNMEYQVGTTSYWIITPIGSNQVVFDWFGKTDESLADDTYCLRLTAYDGLDNQIILDTATATLDNITPTSTGALTAGEVDTDSITIIFASTTPGEDTNEPTTNAYKIFYKEGTSGLTELNGIEKDDSALNAYDYSSATSTKITGLDQNTWYVFNIWTYDEYGNKSSSTEVAIKTNATLSNDSLTFTNAYTIGPDNNIVEAGSSTEWNFRAVVSETNGWYAIGSTTLRLADREDNSSPFSDLEFYWDQTGDDFYEIGTDALNTATLSENSTSTCSGITCTLDFKILFNKSFATTSVNYEAELYSTNDIGTTDNDTYTDFYQVRYYYTDQIHYRWRYDNGGE